MSKMFNYLLATALVLLIGLSFVSFSANAQTKKTINATIKFKRNQCYFGVVRISRDTKYFRNNGYTQLSTLSVGQYNIIRFFKHI